jgi:hypothetical protein
MPWSAPPPFYRSTTSAIVEPSSKILGDDMDDEKSVLEQMTDAMSNAAGATKEAAKDSRQEGQAGSQESREKGDAEEGQKSEKGFEEILGEEISQKG